MNPPDSSIRILRIFSYKMKYNGILIPFAEWEMERFDSRSGESENRHGDDISDDQFGKGSRGRFHGAVHGDRYRHRGGEEDRYNISHCLPW